MCSLTTHITECSLLHLLLLHFCRLHLQHRLHFDGGLEGGGEGGRGREGGGGKGGRGGRNTTSRAWRPGRRGSLTIGRRQCYYLMGSTWLALAPSWSTARGPGLVRAPGPVEEEDSFLRVSVSAAKLSEGSGGRSCYSGDGRRQARGAGPR